MKNIFIATLFIFFNILLSGCGSDSSSDKSDTLIPLSVPTITKTLLAGCSGNYCGSNGNSYTGNGIGIWHSKNSEAPSANLDIKLYNIANKDIMIVFTNEGNNAVSLPNITIDTSLKNIRSDELVQNSHEIIHFERRVDFKELLKEDVLKNQNIKSVSPKVWSKGNQETWLIKPYDTLEKRTATLKEQISSNGRTINFWVEDSEFQTNKITAAILSSTIDKFSSIYKRVVSLAGEPWGAHEHPKLIPNNQPLNIVFANFDKNSEPFGVVGYFWGTNNFLSKYDSNSNEALVIFVDTETIYHNNINNGILYSVSTMAHELTHAINFYQHDVLSNGDSFDTFLEEMSAVMMEDIVSSQIDAVYSDIADRYTKWLADSSNYNYDFTDWSKGSSNYDIIASFGAFLLRQHGIEFYKDLLKTHSDSSSLSDKESSLNILDKTIKKYNNKGLKDALQKWGTGIAMLPADKSPENFGYPEKPIDGGFYLKALDGGSYASARKLPTSSPSALKARGNFPFLRKASNGKYEESFIVPHDVSVTVIIK
ncbi:MAG: hypothetical protein LBD84_02330 [Campylobacteraceae bacterium]|jgi:hypothetical protein|nr:hypothetical protein [Campylobacteraceae bacterium]